MSFLGASGKRSPPLSEVPFSPGNLDRVPFCRNEDGWESGGKWLCGRGAAEGRGEVGEAR